MQRAFPPAGTRHHEICPDDTAGTAAELGCGPSWPRVPCEPSSSGSMMRFPYCRSHGRAFRGENGRETCLSLGGFAPHHPNGFMDSIGLFKLTGFACGQLRYHLSWRAIGKSPALCPYTQKGHGKIFMLPETGCAKSFSVLKLSFPLFGFAPLREQFSINHAVKNSDRQTSPAGDSPPTASAYNPTKRITCAMRGPPRTSVKPGWVCLPSASEERAKHQ